MKKFLVVVDCQNDFITGALGTQEARAIVPNVIDKINEYRQIPGAFICVTLDTHNDRYLSTQEGKNLPVEHCIKGTPGWELPASITDALEGFDKVNYFEKRTFGSFSLACDISDNTGLFNDDVEIELVGLCTDICVVSNALLLKSNFPEARIIVDAICCAGVTPQTHEAALETMRMCQVSVINWKE